MKYFLKFRILKENKEQAVHYFLPDVVSVAKTVEEGYAIAASNHKDNYSFSVQKNKDMIGSFHNDIKPEQVLKFEHDGNILEFSLLSLEEGKEIVEKYLRSKPNTTVRDMEDFYDFVEEYEKIKKKRHSTGPWEPTSGMDPDLRADYAKGEDGDK